MDDPLVVEVRDLAAKVEKLGADVETSNKTQELRRLLAVATLRSQNRRRTIAILTIIGLVAAGGYSNSRAIDRNNLKLCPLVSITIPRPGDPLPAPGHAGDRGRSVIANARAVQSAFGCPKNLGATRGP